MRRRNLLRRLIHTFKRGFKFLLVLFVVALLPLLFFKTSFVHLNKISVRIDGGDVFLKSSDIERVLGERFLGKNILLIGKKEIMYSLAPSFPALGQLTIDKNIIKREIIVSITEKSPIALIKGSVSDNFFVVSLEGEVFGIADKEKYKNLGTIFVEGRSFLVGERIDDENTLTVLSFLRFFGESGISVESAVVDKYYSQIFIKEPKVELIVSSKELELAKEKVFLLKKLFAKFSIDGKIPRKIDVRFNNPVIDF